MAIERKRRDETETSPATSRENRQFWEGLGLDVESMSPKAQAVTGLVVGGVILGSAAALILFTQLWWLIFFFGWWLFPALGVFARGVAGLLEGAGNGSATNGTSKESELLEALSRNGELTPAQAAMETSLSVREADEMLKDLASGGHLDVRVRGGAIFYALWGSEEEGKDGRERA